MTADTERLVAEMREADLERAAKAISRMIPVDGSRWHPAHGHDFPNEYSPNEQRLIRAIARTAVAAALTRNEAATNA